MHRIPREDPGDEVKRGKRQIRSDFGRRRGQIGWQIFSSLTIWLITIRCIGPTSAGRWSDRCMRLSPLRKNNRL